MSYLFYRDCFIIHSDYFYSFTMTECFTMTDLFYHDYFLIYRDWVECGHNDTGVEKFSPAAVLVKSLNDIGCNINQQ